MAQQISQTNRLFSFDSPLGPDKLLVNKFSGKEQMSELFKFQLELVSEDFTIQPEDILGLNVTVGIRHADGQAFRYFNGHISHFAPISHPGRLAYYSAEMVPWLWFLTLTQNCGVFQHKTVVQVIEATFQKFGYRDYSTKGISDRHRPWENCCQYQESAFAFISRLMEIEGIYYYFKHEQGKHTLMMVDHMSAHLPCPFQSTFRYEHEAGAGLYRDQDTILSTDMRKIVKPNQYAHKDYNFKIPTDPLYFETPVERDTGAPVELEVYDYPGEYEWNNDSRNWGDLRMEEQEHDHTVMKGGGNGRALIPGYRFDMTQSDRADQNINFLVFSVEHEGQEGTFVAGADARVATYSNKFVAMPSSIQFRPTLKTDEPRIVGSQTAFVVGPKGEEIYTDDWGRVRVKFHWDRSPKDANGADSCWIRVMQPWGGPTFGHIWIPRVGMEVIVDFIDGDPDRPIITGCVYHNLNRPPYPLPANKNWNGVKTRSTKGGTADNYNELRFDDTKDSELIRIQAEKDLHIFVKNDTSEYIKHDRFLEVENDKHEQIDHDKYVTVKGRLQEDIQDKMAVQVGKDATLLVKQNQTELVEGTKNSTVKGDYNQRVDGNWSLDVAGNTIGHGRGDFKAQSDGDIHIKSAKKIVLEAGAGITIACGGSFIEITAAGVRIHGNQILLNCDGGDPGGAADANTTGPDTPQKFKNPDDRDDKRFQIPSHDEPQPGSPSSGAGESSGTGTGQGQGGSDQGQSGSGQAQGGAMGGGSGQLSDNPWVVQQPPPAEGDQSTEISGGPSDGLDQYDQEESA